MPKCSPNINLIQQKLSRGELLNYQSNLFAQIQQSQGESLEMLLQKR